MSTLYLSASNIETGQQIICKASNKAVPNGKETGVTIDVQRKHITSSSLMGDIYIFSLVFFFVWAMLSLIVLNSCFHVSVILSRKMPP